MAVYSRQALGAEPFAGDRAARRRLANVSVISLAASARPVRGAILLGARAIGVGRHWLATGWRRPLVGLGALAAIAYAAERLPRVGDGTIFSLWKLIALYLLVAFLATLWRARTRVVVERFVDYSKSTESDEEVAHGLTALLVGELAELRALYDAVDESRTIGTAVGQAHNQPVQATVQVDDVSSFLENAASSESKVSIGPLVLPLGTILALFGRLAQGPRMSGGLHVVRDAGEGAAASQLVLTAYVSSSGGVRHWRVVRELSVEDEAQPAVAALVSELACRMFVDLALESSVGWRAGQKFLDGLNVYRSSLHASADRKLKLRRAEQLLVEALAEDKRIPLVDYNLGVVYTELRRLSPGPSSDGISEGDIYFTAAEQAFLNEIRRTPDRWEPYYALAQTYFDQGRHDEVTGLCHRVIDLASHPRDIAKAYDLKGLAEANLQEEIGIEMALRRVRNSRLRAYAYALFALARAEYSRRGLIDARRLAARCMQNLATPEKGDWTLPPSARGRVELRWRSGLLRDASRLGASEAPHTILAGLAAKNERPQLALRELKEAVRIAPTDAISWAMLAQVDATLKESAATAGEVDRAAKWAALARKACGRAVNFVDLRVQDGNATITLVLVAQVLAALGEEERATHVAGMLEVEAALASANDVAAVDAAVLDLPSDGWAAGLASFRRGLVDAPGRVDHYRTAIELLRKDFPEEVRRRGMRALLAQELARRGDLKEALKEAEHAIGLDPCNVFERDALGDVYLVMDDFGHAQEAFESALLWEPDSASLHQKIGDCNRERAARTSDSEVRRAFLLTAERHYLNALELHGPSNLDERGRIHYGLARLYSELDEFEKVIPHVLNVNVLADPAGRVLSDVIAGEAFHRGRNHDFASSVLRRAVDQGEALVADKEVGPDYDAGGNTDPGWPLAFVVGWAYYWLARCYADRDVRIEDADKLLIRGGELIDMLPPSTDPSTLRCALAGGRGRIAYKQGLVDEAIALLEESLGIQADAESYLHLAEAYAAKADRARTKAARTSLAERAARACRHVLEDVSRQYDAEAEELLSRLNGSTAQAVAATP